MQVISSGGIPLVARLRRARLPAASAGLGGRRRAGRGLAALDRLHARPAARLPARGRRGDRRDRLVRRGRPSLDRGLALATVAAALLFAAAGFALSRPYLRVADAHPGARRTPATVEAYSGPPWIFLVAPEENLVWGGATAPLRDGLSNVPEKTLFPGLAIVVLAIVGLGSSRLSALASQGARDRQSSSPRSSPSDSGRAGGCCGPIASSTRSYPAGRRSGFPGGWSPSLPGAGAARRWGRPAGDRGGGRALDASLGRRRRRRGAGAGDRGRGQGAPLRPVRPRRPARGAAGPAPDGVGPRPAAPPARPSGPPTTGATSSGRRTDSRSWSTGAPASTRRSPST